MSNSMKYSTSQPIMHITLLQILGDMTNVFPAMLSYWEACEEY